MSSTGYYYRTREGEGGAGAVSSGGGSARVLLTWFLAFLVAFLLACFHVGCLLETKNHMGCLLRQYRCPLATRVVSEKGSRVARPQGEKVPTRGFSAKKEGVWRDLSRLADFRRKRKSCGATSLPFFTTRRKRKVGGTTSVDSRIFGEKGSCVA